MIDTAEVERRTFIQPPTLSFDKTMYGMSEDDYEPEYETEQICIGDVIWLEVLSVVRTFTFSMRIA